MHLFRLSRSRHKDSLLTGLGGEYAGGRWHKQGQRIIYTSSTRSLSLLEKLVHIEDTFLLPDDLFFFTLELPPKTPIKVIDSKFLHKGWHKLPYSNKTQSAFDEFRKEADGLVLKVPSAIIKEEFNFIINPYHEDISKVKLVESTKFNLDSRL